jgi:hypothetical protein
MRSGPTQSAALFRIGKFHGPITPTTPRGVLVRRVFFVRKSNGFRVSSERTRRAVRQPNRMSSHR